jgi:hypothetical protein
MNEWLLIPLTVVSFVIIGCCILAACFGAWAGVHWLVGRITGTDTFGRLRRSG